MVTQKCKLCLKLFYFFLQPVVIGAFFFIRLDVDGILSGEQVGIVVDGTSARVNELPREPERKKVHRNALKAGKVLITFASTRFHVVSDFLIGTEQLDTPIAGWVVDLLINYFFD